MRLFLFDGTAISYRAFFALDSSLSTSTGIPTNASYGVARMMVRFLKDHLKANKDYAAFVFDAPEKTFRHEMFETYKSHRRPTPDSFKVQVPYIKRLVEAMGIKVLEVPGYEADDVIATLATRGKEKFDEIVIVTADKDMLQIVGGNIRVWRIVKGISEFEVYDEEKVREKFGVPPEGIPHLLALMGDAVDDVPGVKGIGEKTAKDLVSRFENLDSIYENLRKLPERIRKVLTSGKESAYKSLELVLLRTDVPLDLKWEELLYKGYDREKLLQILKELEFASIMRELSLHEEIEKEYRLVESEEELEKILSEIYGKEVAIDTETTSLDPLKAELVGISLSFEEGKAYYIPVSHRSGENVSKESVIKGIRRIFESSRIIGQNLKYDLSVLKAHGVEMVTPHFDTMIAAWVLNPDEKKFSLDELSLRFLGYKMVEYEEVAPPSQNLPLFSGDFSDVSTEKAKEYSAEDADITYRLYRKLEPLIREKELEKVFWEIEMPLVPVLAEMEMNGVYFDLDYLKELSEKFEEKMERIKDEIFVIAGESFNLNSSVQVAKILEKLGIKPSKKTKTGKISTSAEVLEELATEHEIARLILDYRKYQKLKSTYLDSIPKLVNPKTGRVHTSFNQTGTATGRLSSSEPNLQNLPKREEEGREIRKAIRPQKDGWYILSADYSQIELRILAHFSKDENLIRAFKEDLDIHRMTAARIFGVPEEMVSDQMRRVGKLVNFSIIYGVTPYGLSVRLKVPVKDAQRMINSYFQLYPKVREFIREVVDEAERKGEVRTLFGRRREIPQLRSRDKTRKAEGERIAINTPIQGTAADIIKLAMIKLHKRFKGKRTKMILQVHDELVFEVPEDELEEVKEIVREEMENVVELEVPLKVDISVGKEYH